MNILTIIFKFHYVLFKKSESTKLIRAKTKLIVKTNEEPVATAFGKSFATVAR